MIRVRPSRTASMAGLGQGFRFDKPLEREVRLDDRLAPVTVAHHVAVVFRLQQDPIPFKILDDLSPTLKAIQPSIEDRRSHSSGLLHQSP